MVGSLNQINNAAVKIVLLVNLIIVIVIKEFEISIVRHKFQAGFRNNDNIRKSLLDRVGSALDRVSLHFLIPQCHRKQLVIGV